MTLEQLLKNPEGKKLEFKRDLSSPRPLLKTLVAFANTAGGKLIIGVDDDKSIFGVNRPLDEEERLANIIADSIFPRLIPNIEMTTVEGKTLLIVEVFLSNARPHYLKSDGEAQGVYVRLGSSNRQADKQLVAELHRSVGDISFDETPMIELNLDDLNLDVAQELFGNKCQLNEKTLRTLKLVANYQDRLVPTRGAVLLFGKERTFHFPDAWVQCGRFFGTEKIDIFDQIDIDVPLPKAVDEVMIFLKKHAYRGADLSEIRRKDVWSIPLSILREVLINALVHSDYSQRGAPIRVVFLDDRIEIESHGILLPGLTVEDIKAGTSIIRNNVIARMFKELGLIEQWGTGIRRVFQEAQELGLPEPSIVEIGMRLRFIIPLAVIHGVEPKDTATGSSLRAQSGAQSGAQSRSVLTALAEKELSATELMNILGLKSKTGAFKRAVKELLEQGNIKYTIPDKPNSRLQKYRITDKGSRLLGR